MNKLMKLFLPVMILVFAVLPVSQLSTVEAASSYKDGEYTIPFQVLTEDGSSESKMTEFVDTSATLIVKDGKNTVQMTLKNASWWKSFTVASQSVTTVSESNDTRVVQVGVSGLDQAITATASVDVPDVYKATHNVKIKFDTSSVPTGNGSAATTDEKTDNVAGDGGQEANPKTADNTPIVLFSVALVVSGLVLGRKFLFAK